MEENTKEMIGGVVLCLVLTVIGAAAVFLALYVLFGY